MAAGAQLPKSTWSADVKGGSAERFSGRERLESWKAIANYLNRTVRTVQRWESNEGLPVRRLQHEGGASVFAFKHELDQWTTARSLQIHKSSASPIQDFKPSESTIGDNDPAITKSVTVPPSENRFRLRYAGIVAAAVVVVAATLSTSFLTSRKLEDETLPGLFATGKVIPRMLTTRTGVERQPALSRDGRQVAYVWDNPEGTTDLFVRLIGAPEHLRLTNDAAIEESPTWSPDGLSIAYVRRLKGGQRELRVVSALGNNDRLFHAFEVPALMDEARSFWTSAVWSPDSRWIALTVKGEALASLKLAMFDTETGHIHAMTAPPDLALDLTPAFSSDGTTLAFARSGSVLRGSIHVADLTWGDGVPSLGPQRVLEEANKWNAEPVWTVDDQHLIFSSGPWPRVALWSIPVDGSAKPIPLTDAGLGSSQPTVAALGKTPEGQVNWRLVYAVGQLENDIWKIKIPDTPLAPVEPERTISSTQRERYPDWSPSNDTVAFLSDRSGHREVWVANADGSAAQQWTELESANIWRPSWSPDGKRIAYTAEIDQILRAYIQETPLSAPRPVTHDLAEDNDLAWSRDGETLYVSSSNRGGRPGIWAVTLKTGETVRIAEGTGIPLGEDPSGSWLLQVVFDGENQSAERVNIQSGVVEPLPLAPGTRSSFEVAGGGLYYLSESDSRFMLRRWTFESRQDVALLQFPQKPEDGITISPDQQFVSVALIDTLRADLMVADSH